MFLSDICLSCASGLSREERGLGRPKLAQNPHVTRIPFSRSKGQGHQAALVSCTGRPTWTYSNGDLSIFDVYRVTTCRPGRRNIVAAGRLPTACYTAH